MRQALNRQPRDPAGLTAAAVLLLASFAALAIQILMRGSDQ